MLFNIEHIINITTLLFCISMVGVVLNRKNILISIMSIELMLLAVNLNFSSISVYLDDAVGQIFVLFILTIAAAESAIGLALLTAHYNLQNTIHMGKVH